MARIFIPFLVACMLPVGFLQAQEFKHTAELYVLDQISEGYERIDKDPYDIEAYIAISEGFLMFGFRVKALEELTNATFDNWHSKRIWYQIAYVEQLSGRPNEAASALAQAERL
ncbi:MAG: hypothetical protein JKY15_04765 [Deltaproteobacteria bacterium]|nr:hypothetical protein [Deltaproteobacteria bacterium]